MRSSRLPASLAANALATAVARQRAQGVALADLTESNPTAVGLDYPADLLAPLADPRGLSYEPGPLGLRSAREAVAADFARRGVPVEADRVALTASTSEAYALLFKLLCDPGDAVLVPRPSYPLFDHLTRLEAVDAVPYDLDDHGTWRLDVPALEQRIDARTRAVLVVSPNNPTGSCLHADELAALAALCAARGLALVGDEVFADYPIEPAGPTCSVLAQSEALTVSLGGLSKSAGLPQLKLGWIAFGGPPDEVRRTMAAYEVVADAYLSVSTPVQVAAPALIAAGSRIRSQIQARIARNLAALDRLRAPYPSISRPRVEGGWSAVLRVPAVRPEEQLVIDLVDEDHVIVHPGYFFDFPREAFLVVSLLVEPATFDAALPTLLARAAAGSAA
ncbi:MAG: pyridoxal phosphate-dependent aminotransferase [Acidobacteriota bacterium]